MSKDQGRAAVVAVDLGAESCRVCLLRFADAGPQVTMVHRCTNAPVQTERGLVWDFERIFDEVVQGLRKCAELAPEGVTSIGVDGWAVDYVRLDAKGKALHAPFCYRDERTISAQRELQSRISAAELYRLTGAQDLRINTLYQLYADNLAGIPAELPWITLPEYLLYRLGAERVCEHTNATHTQMLSVVDGNWSDEVLSAAGHSLVAAPKVVQPGSDVGRLVGPLSELPAFCKTRLIAPACHDTASAIAGIPAEGDDWAFISSGTWSLVGTIVDNSITSAEAFKENFTNQGGVCGTVYLLKNVNGMWILKQCLDHWKRRGEDWRVEDIVEACRAVGAPRFLLDVDDPKLMLPGDMPSRINEQLGNQGEKSISAAPEYASLIFHSLAARYARIIESLGHITSKRFRRIYVVGGGSRNSYLNGLVEAATGLEVIRASAESSTIGNFGLQLAATDGLITRESLSRWTSVLNRPAVWDS
jgi:rhamnulokinase